MKDSSDMNAQEIAAAIRKHADKIRMMGEDLAIIIVEESHAYAIASLDRLEQAIVGDGESVVAARREVSLIRTGDQIRADRKRQEEVEAFERAKARLTEDDPDASPFAETARLSEEINQRIAQEDRELHGDNPSRS